MQAAQQSKEFESDESNLMINKRMVGGIAQVHTGIIGGWGGEIFTWPYPLKVQVCLPRDQRPAL